MLVTRRTFLAGMFATGVVTAIPLPSFETDRSTVLADIEAGKKAILESTGVEPNTIIMGPDAAEALDVHVDRTDISVQYLQESDGFIADKVFPVTPVGDSYFIWDR